MIPSNHPDTSISLYISSNGDTLYAKELKTQDIVWDIRDYKSFEVQVLNVFYGCKFFQQNQAY